MSNEFTKKTVEIEPKRSDIDFNRKIIRIKMTFIVQKTQETGTVERGTVYSFGGANNITTIELN